MLWRGLSLFHYFMVVLLGEYGGWDNCIHHSILAVISDLPLDAEKAIFLQKRLIKKYINRVVLRAFWFF